jgi:hypothetical protein
MTTQLDAMTEPVAEQLNRILTALGDRVHAAVADQLSVTIEQLTAAVETDRRAALEAAARQAASDTQREVSTRLIDEFAQREAQIREGARAEGFADALAQQTAILADERTQHEAALSVCRAELLSELQSTKTAHAQARAAEAAASTHALERLSAAVRALNQSTTLSETLDALLRAAKAEAERVAIFLVREGQLRLWSHDGFPALDSSQALDLACTDTDVLAELVRTGEARHETAKRPSFCPDASATFVAVPLALHGHMTAVLCADTTIDADRIPSLMLRLDLAAQCASKVLELITAERLARAAAATHARGTAPASTHM